MKHLTCMTSALALSAAMLLPVKAVAEETSGSDDTLTVTRLSPYFGDIDPFFGVINPFYGDIDPFFGVIDPFFGNINPFYGDINPFYGTISPFWGDIDPFWGDIDPFFGNIEAFWGDIDPFFGVIDPFWGDIGTFWGDIGPVWGDINASWGALDPFSKQTAADYDELVAKLQDLVSRSEAVWGNAIKEKTRLSFSDGFADAVFARHGIDLTDPKTIANLSAADRSLFFLDWYDGLMAFSGVDQVDHWMPMINWSPSLTQDQGMGERSRIGLLDMTIGKTESFKDNIEFKGGYKGGTEGHGAAVASLILSPHDGEGIMGIAPSATVLNYNPFDKTNSASWDDVESGINKLAAEGASVINISLGVPEWTLHQEWARIFDRAMEKSFKYDTVLVKAAGNEGITQTQDIEWDNDDVFDNLILVGSVNPIGGISAFSNRPGEACLVVDGTCDEEDKLKYRFMVAPGELILVSDGAGGVTRVSGTSFAAPLVSGAITLLHDRWPWFKDYAEETVDIMFESARDLGAPGVDSVYGHGLLNVEASQSPLSFDSLVFYQSSSGVGDTKLKTFSSTSFKNSMLRSGALDLWQLEGASVFAMEEIGDTHRDFAIPLSTLVHGETAKFNDTENRYQRHLYQRLIDWANGTGFSDMQSYDAPLAVSAGWNLGITASPLRYAETTTLAEGDLNFRSGIVLQNAEVGLEVRLGSGDGAIALAGQSGFGFYSDYDVETGGVNPLLGFASGDEYASASFGISQNTYLTLGFTNKDDNHIVQDPLTGQNNKLVDGYGNYRASAFTAGFDHRIFDTLSISGSYVVLNEETGLLGAQGTGALSLSGGSRSDSMTLGATVRPTDDLTVSLSATAGHTRGTQFDGSLLGVADDGLQTTAFALSAQKTGLFGKEDGLRWTFMQPLHIESGGIEYRSIQVVDRRTGELGTVTETWNLNNSNRKLVSEVLYATPIMSDALELSLFGEARFNDDKEEDGGTGWSLGFNLGGRF